MSQDVKANALGFYSGIFIYDIDIIYSIIINLLRY